MGAAPRHLGSNDGWILINFILLYLINPKELIFRKQLLPQFWLSFFMWSISSLFNLSGCLTFSPNSLEILWIGEIFIFVHDFFFFGL